jgi:hypothetical protein
MKKLTASLIPVLLVGALACSKSEPPPPPPATVAAAPTTTLPPAPSVSGATLGNAIGADKKVAAPSETFAAKDTIYASVETAGTGHVKLRAVWTFTKGTKTAQVNESVVEFESAGPAVNEFHVSKPSGWPHGDYKVEVFLNDAATPAVTRSFKVG